jgi:tripartite-type tricarboxylate transporter receptor subunit TctC
MKRRDCIKTLSATAFLLSAKSFAQGHIEVPKIIRIIVPYSPGGSNDVFGRALAQKISGSLNTKVIVENRPGAGGATGAVYVANSQGDGANLLIGSNSMVMNAVVQVNPQYDPVKSFKTVAILNTGPNLILVNKTSKYNTLQGLIDGMKSGEVRNYGSAGIGSAAHLFTELLNRDLKTSVQHIPYKGITNAIIDMIGGSVDLVIATPASASGQLNAGYIKALAVTSSTPSRFFPGMPTVSQNVPNYEAQSWWGIFASYKTPPELVQLLNQHIIGACKDSSMIDMFNREATIPVDMNIKQAADFVASEKDRWGKVATNRNIRSES